VEQESLANANVSAQSSACKKALVKKSMTNQCKESWKVHSVGYKRCRRFYIHSFSCCCLHYRFRDIDAFSTKTAHFPTPPLFDAP